MYSFVILLAALSTMVLAHSHEYYPCVPCKGEECYVQPEGCEYGIAKDACGRWQCMSGPGERCGGRDNHLGKCGDGMSCKCGKCRGCSIDKLNIGIIKCDTNTALCH